MTTVIRDLEDNMKCGYVCNQRVLMVVAALACVGCLAGCSEGKATVAVEAVQTTTSVVESEGVSTQAGTAVFRSMQEAMEPVQVFGLAQVPDDMVVAQNWWPVVEDESPNASRFEVNPRVVGAGEMEPEGQLLFRCGDGWVCILENFRGDLGDVQGEAVGAVAGAPAYGFEVNGGWLVQWAYEGRWYGVFGRGVSRALINTTALSLTLVIDGD